MEQKKLTAQIAAAYWGANAIQILSDGDTIHATVDLEFISSLIDGETQGRLLLKPLSAITEEDAVEVAKIAGCYYKLEESLIKAGKEMVTEYWRRQSNIHGVTWRRVVNYLCRQGYDMGFEEIESLISSGIAIDSTTFKNQPK